MKRELQDVKTTQTDRNEKCTIFREGIKTLNFLNLKKDNRT